MPGGSFPTKHASQLIPPPPFAIAGSAAAKASRAAADRHGENGLSSKSSCIAQTAASATYPGSAILAPRPGRDVVALIFVLLMLPQGISCLVLFAYILLGSFKAWAGRIIAKYFLPCPDGPQYELDARPATRTSYYRSKLLGEFLQLFSINSFILLVCHYTMPPEWGSTLIILAKSIIASKLVGSFTTGSTTYVSVVSSTPSASTTTTTTTTSNGQLHGGFGTSDKFFTGSLFNLLRGLSFVVGINRFIRDHVRDLNYSLLLSDVVKFYRNCFFTVTDGQRRFSAEKFFSVMFTKSPFFTSYKHLSPKNSIYYTSKGSGFVSRPSTTTAAVIRMLTRFSPLQESTLKKLSFAMVEAEAVVNFAYLVLCIHVISLTISPFLRRTLILKTYSNTLDHLSALSPDIPFGGYKKTSIISNISKETTTDSVVVISLEASALQQSPVSGAMKIDVDPAISSTQAPMYQYDTTLSVPADNFKIFCLKAPMSSVPISSSKASHSKTVVDRKRSNSSAAPSTTIMDRYFTISFQPLWSWLAAIKILVVNPMLFSGRPSGLGNCSLKMAQYALDSKLRLSVVAIDGASVCLRVLNPSYLKPLKNALEVRVNGVPWNFVQLLSSESSSGASDDYIQVSCLSPLRQFCIDIYHNTELVGHIMIRTAALKVNLPTGIQLSKSQDVNSLQHSLIYAIACLSDMRLEFKRAKKDESKRVGELRKQIDGVRSKIAKYGDKQANEARTIGKVKGLQGSISQLEGEIAELERQIHDSENNSANFEKEYQSEEKKLEMQIFDLEAYIQDYEKNTTKLRADVKTVEEDKRATEAKLKKLSGKLQSRQEDIARIESEIVACKKSFISKLHKRQKKVQDRCDTIVPKISASTSALKEELETYVGSEEVMALE